MAGRFRFSLEVVRRLRLLARDERRRALAESLRAARSAEAQVNDLQQSLRDSLRFAAVQEQGERIEIGSLRAEQLHRAWLHEQIRLAEEQVAARRTEVDAERARLAVADKQWRVIEKLRERRWVRHREQVRRAEQTGDDEAATQRYLRRTADRASGESFREARG